jgi:hypothetical protein
MFVERRDGSIPSRFCFGCIGGQPQGVAVQRALEHRFAARPGTESEAMSLGQK